MSKSHGDKKRKAHDKKAKKKIAAVEATATPALDTLPERASSDRPALEKASVPRQGVSGPAKPGFDGAVEGGKGPSRSTASSSTSRRRM